jgi:hypothetical protein
VAEEAAALGGAALGRGVIPDDISASALIRTDITDAVLTALASVAPTNLTAAQTVKWMETVVATLPSSTGNFTLQYLDRRDRYHVGKLVKL